MRPGNELDYDVPGPAMPQPAPIAAPVAEIERRLQWRVLAVGSFLALIAALATLAATSLLVPVRMLDGLPGDPDVALAHAEFRAGLPMRAGELRFRSALTGEAPAGTVFGAADAPRVERAIERIGRARARHRGDARLEVMLAHLDLALQRYVRAERRYRAVIDRGVDCPEARLGLGLTLALEAGVESEPLRARALRLEALAQWVAVNPRSPAYGPALYDRALLLAEVGRRVEAARVAGEYLALDGTGAWAGRLQHTLKE
jgi:hypothetical protein